MKAITQKYEFTFTISGYGADEDEAWADAVESFYQDDGGHETTDWKITDPNPFKAVDTNE